MINVKVELLDQNVDAGEIMINLLINVKVELLDQNVDAGEIVKTPTADLFVVSPARLEISCLPFKEY